MVVRSAAAPPTPWSKDLAEPKIHESAYVHSFSNLIGDVTVCENVLISPGTSIRADEGAPFYIGSAANIQDGVVIHGLEQGRVVGADGQDYSVWIGHRSCITHMALIHGPAYIGNDCFIGFRSTVFNARIGDGCVIMMHALIQDVDIPPGKYVPSGAVITSQQQVERLSNVTDADRVFAKRVIEINGALLGEAPNSSDVEPTTDQPITPSSSKNISGTSDNQSVGNMSSNGDLYNQVRGLAAQGCTFTAEHANKRRFKTKSWLSAGFVEGRSADQIIANLSRILANHAGEYVQLIAVDPNSKSRSAEIIVQRPGDNAPIQAASGNAYSAPARSSGGGVQSGAVSGDLTSQIRSFAAQGCTFTAEHANKRRFKTKSWLSAGFVEGHSAEQIIANVSALLGQYAGEYVQLIAVDPNSKSRVAEIIVQRPGETTTLATGGAANTHRGSGIVNTAVGGDVASQIAALASQGCTFTAEHASTRRFKTQSWLGAGFVDGHSAGQILGNVQAIAGQFPNEYVQLIAVDPSTKTRVAEIIVQRPGNSAPTQATSNTTTSFASSAPANTTNIGFSNNHGGNKLTGDVVSKVRSLLMQGYKIGTEHADKRRFRVKSWSSCGTIDSTQENEVLRRLETCLQDHSGEYVRLIGVDEAARRRVLEEIIQRP